MKVIIQGHALDLSLVWKISSPNYYYDGSARCILYFLNGNTHTIDVKGVKQESNTHARIINSDSAELAKVNQNHEAFKVFYDELVKLWAKSPLPLPEIELPKSVYENT